MDLLHVFGVDIDRIQQCERECQDKPNQQEFESCMNTRAGKVLDKFPSHTDELLAKLKAI